MSYAEINAHREVYDQTTMLRWAISQADFRNAHFSNDVQGSVDDMLGRGEDRTMRKIRAQKEKLDVAMLNAKLSTMRKGAPPPEGLHPVFIGEYHAGKEAS